MIQHLSLGDGIDLYLGDSGHLMEEWRTEPFADLILSDPPYGIGYRGRVFPELANDDTPHTAYVGQMARLLKNDCAMLLFSQYPVVHQWDLAMRGAGLDVQRPIVWDKIHASGAGDAVGDLRRRSEWLLDGHKGCPPIRDWVDQGRFFPEQPDRTLNYLTEDNIWRIHVPLDKKSRRHPTPKPVRLMERAILNYSDKDDVVFDPFMGSSPVGVAAVNLDRRYIGIELEPAYFNLAVHNVQEALAWKRTKKLLADKLDTDD